MDAEMIKIGEILEKMTPADVPFPMKYYLPTGWGKKNDGKWFNRTCIKRWAADFDFVRCSASMEIPFATSGG